MTATAASGTPDQRGQAAPGAAAAAAVRRKATITRVGRFHGNFPGANWLSQAWSPDGTQLAYGGKTQNGAGVLQVWDGDSGHHEAFGMRHLTHGVTGAVISLAWAPDSKHLATMEADHKSGRLTVHIRSQAERSRAMACRRAWRSSQVDLVAGRHPARAERPGLPAAPSCSTRQSGSQRRVLDDLSGPVAWQPEGRLIAGVDETSVVLCDPATGGRSRRLAGQRAPAHGDRLGAARQVPGGRGRRADPRLGRERRHQAVAAAVDDGGGRPRPRRHGHRH